MPSTQAYSHGAGQILPVISGQTLVMSRSSKARFQFFLNAASFHSGIRLLTGHPQWQNGTPQSMHLCAWPVVCSAAGTGATSLKSLTRSQTGRYSCALRSI